MSVAIVTGAAGGLGQGITEALLRDQYSVCMLDVSEERGTAAAKKLAEVHGEERVLFVLCDITKRHEYEAAWDTCKEKLGAASLVVNNAGVVDEVNHQRTVDINLMAVIHGTTIAQKRMRRDGEREGGVVLNIASSTGLYAFPLCPIYCATKHAVVGLSTSYGHPTQFAATGVKVVCLCTSSFLSPLLLNQPPINPDLDSDLWDINPMPIEDVVATAMRLLKEGKNGSVMVLEKGKAAYYHSEPRVDHGFYRKDGTVE